ncbi:hypothetical protein GALMADRAFT_934533 [Galerina marginata CBS 339.88]|uniref:Uncharacterized protein n=1 Tax=Galerina marginata (strain CBS 339.88) TaxID=685588 RepID=A0A067SGG4_GALM3|nr:hypothetical protein GALMADRAFT_934533 [Galerina marginata CBS 339.88]
MRLRTTTWKSLCSVLSIPHRLTPLLSPPHETEPKAVAFMSSAVINSIRRRQMSSLMIPARWTQNTPCLGPALNCCLAFGRRSPSSARSHHVQPQSGRRCCAPSAVTTATRSLQVGNDWDVLPYGGLILLSCDLALEVCV